MLRSVEKLWSVSQVWAAMYPQAWMVQAEYFMLSLRRDKAIHSFRTALRHAQKERFVYAAGKVCVQLSV